MGWRKKDDIWRNSSFRGLPVANHVAFTRSAFIRPNCTLPTPGPFNKLRLNMSQGVPLWNDLTHKNFLAPTIAWSGPKFQVDSNFEEILWYHILAIRQLIMVLGWLITFAFVVAFYCCFGWLPEWSVGFVSYLCGWKLGWLAGCLYYWLISTIVVCWEYLTTWLWEKEMSCSGLEWWWMAGPRGGSLLS